MRQASDTDIQDFAEEMQNLFGDRLMEVILYGSYARGEEHPGSDVDIAVIVDGKKDGDRWQALQVAQEFLVERDIECSPRVFDKDEFEEKKKQGYSFHTAVEEDGVKIRAKNTTSSNEQRKNSAPHSYSSPTKK